MNLNPRIPINSKINSNIIATYILVLKILNSLCIPNYKSKTELRLVYTKSFIFIQKAKKRYKAKPKPRVTNVKYIKVVRTTFARIPNLSAIRWQT